MSERLGSSPWAVSSCDSQRDAGSAKQDWSRVFTRRQVLTRERRIECRQATCSIDLITCRYAMQVAPDAGGGAVRHRAKRRKVNCPGPLCGPAHHFLVVKLVRAFGGCLGTKRRRRTWQNCDKLRRAVSRHRPANLRIGKPTSSHVDVSLG